MNDSDDVTKADSSTHSRPPLPPWLAWSLMVGLGLAIWILGPHWPQSRVKPEGWKLVAVFLPTILGLMLRPLPGGAVVLMGVTATALVGALSLKEALGGYMNPTVWLVLAAFLLSRAFIKTGLARRIALTFVRILGRNSLGLSYALLASDTVLAGMIPSNAARVGGVLLPIGKSIAELYQSRPGATAHRLGRYLMLTMYQGDVIACALFLTGQASNPLIASQAADLTGGEITLSYGSWLLYALAPALASLLIVPWLIFRWEAPEVRQTPAAAEFAIGELKKMGPPGREEWTLVVIFLTVCGLWILTSVEHTALVALAGVGVLLLSGILTWEDATSEKAAWDVFIWYGGLVQMGEQLQKSGVATLFAETVASPFLDWHWFALFLGTLSIYFYAHYAFASITAHVLSMYAPFVLILIGAGCPPAIPVLAFAYFANLSAGLTHYGTTPGPILFSTGYVPVGAWWRVGLRMSFVNVAIWLSLGLSWWKFWGLW